MTIRKNTLNFDDKYCKIINVEKTSLRIINTFTRKISICFKKNTKFLRDLLSALQKKNMSSSYMFLHADLGRTWEWAPS